MIDQDGNPSVVEFNCRFGDPEAQPVMMRLQSDLTELCQLALAGRLDSAQAHGRTSRCGCRAGGRRLS